MTNEPGWLQFLLVEPAGDVCLSRFGSDEGITLKRDELQRLFEVLGALLAGAVPDGAASGVQGAMVPGGGVGIDEREKP